MYYKLFCLVDINVLFLMNEALIERILKMIKSPSVSLSDHIYHVEYGFHFSIHSCLC